MKNDIKLLIKLLGLILKVFSVFNAVPAAVAIISALYTSDINELWISLYFSIIGAISYILGRALESVKVDMKDLIRKPYITISAIALSWLILPLIGGIIYWITGLSWVDAYFESMSAWSTTGFTMYKSVETLPYSIRFWRSFEQWLGGIGIVTFAVYILKNNRILYSIVKFEGKEDFIEPTIESTIRRIFKIYAVLTFIGASFLSFSGLDAFTSINLSMTALATGGMSPIDYLNLNILQKAILILLMLAGATSFVFYAKLQQKKWNYVKKYEPLYWMLALIFLVSLLGTLVDKLPFIDAFFHATSGLTCTGFSYENLKSLSDAYVFGIISLMIIGGAVGSTSGAIKIDRIIILFKGLKQKIKEIISAPKEIIVEAYINQIIEYKDVYNVGLYFFIYIIILLVSSILFALYTRNFLYAMFEVASAMGGVGLSLGYISSAMPLVYKILFIFLMWAGRIELFIALAFIVSLSKFVHSKA